MTATPAALTITTSERGEEHRWDAYVDAHPLGTPFHRTGWRTVVAEEFGFRSHYLQAVEDGRIRGVLPLFEAPQLPSGTSLLSVPFAVYGGVLADDDTVTAALMDEARELLRTIGGELLELRHREERSALGDVRGTDLYVTYVRELPDDPGECLQMLPRKARAAARNGRNKFDLVGVSTLDMLPDFHRLFLMNKRRLGSPCFRRSFFERIVAAYGSDVGLFNVMREGRLVSSVLYFVYRDTIFPYWMGDADEARGVSASNFMYMALMEYAVEQGLRYFDFGRSRSGTHSARFKEHQGFEATPLHYAYALHRAEELPSNNPSNPKYDVVKKTWSRMPFWMCNAVGPRLMRYFA